MKQSFLFLFLLNIAFCYAQTYDDIVEKYRCAMKEAKHDSIVVKTHDDSCYLELHYYKNGSLYTQVPIVNGKKTGTYKEFWPNGQIYQQYEFINGHRVDSTTDITYNIDGSCHYILIYIVFRKKIYSCRSDFYYGRNSIIIIHQLHPYKMVAEYWYEDGRWKKRPYHVKPVRYSNRLLRIYRKKWEKKFPDIEF